MKENVLTEILVLSYWEGNKYTNYCPAPLDSVEHIALYQLNAILKSVI